MKHSSKLPKEIEDEIVALLKQAGDARRSGDNSGRELYALRAWDKLPEPKLSWEFFSNTMPRNNTLFYRDTRQFDKALHWLDITRESYGPDRDDVIEFVAATLYYEMGHTDKAFEEFDRQYKAFKTRPFQGLDKKYLDFYLGRKDYL